MQDKQQARPVCWCERCGGEIYDVEDAYFVADEMLCYECMMEVVCDEA